MPGKSQRSSKKRRKSESVQTQLRRVVGNLGPMMRQKLIYWLLVILYVEDGELNIDKECNGDTFEEIFETLENFGVLDQIQACCKP